MYIVNNLLQLLYYAFVTIKEPVKVNRCRLRPVEENNTQAGANNTG